VLADRDREAHAHRPADRDHRVRVEARVGADRQRSVGSGGADPADRLAQEVGGASGRVCPALAQPRHEHVTRAGGDREQGVIAPHAGVAMVAGAFLLEPVRLADRRVEIDRERRVSGARPGGPGPAEQLPAHQIELADVAPAEAAQEGAQGRGRLDREAEDATRAARPQRVRVGDRVAPGKGRHDERQELVADVRPAGRRAQVEMALDELPEAQVMGQGDRQQEARVGHQAIVIEGHVEPVEAVR
jgi:hypothetical protein